MHVQIQTHYKLGVLLRQFDMCIVKGQNTCEYCTQASLWGNKEVTD